MKICSKCGEKFESGKFCKFCGGALIDEAGETQELHCTECGAVLSAGTKFCPKCGTKLSDGKISVRDLSKIDTAHLELYDLPTLVRAQHYEDGHVFMDFIMENYGMEGIVAEEERTHDSGLQCFIGIRYVADDAYKGNESKGVELLKKSAEQGNEIGQYWLGLVYEVGFGGCEIDERKAFEWYLKSAEQGEADAQYEVGNFYDNGYGDCPEDEGKAFEWYMKAAEKGQAEAANRIGVLYSKWGGAVNEKKSFEYFLKAAEAGDKWGMYNVANECLKGIGTDVDVKQAIFWYEKSAEKGNSDAQYKLGDIYENGIGVDEDINRAIEWYKKAAENDNGRACYHLSQLYFMAKKIKGSPILAFKYAAKSSELGDIGGMLQLAFCYEHGIGCIKDKALAKELYQKVEDAQKN